MDTSNQFYFQWHFLSKCNLRCKHCYQEEYAHEEMNFEKLIQVANQIILALEKWNMYGRISLTGGEPFVSTSLFPLLEYLNSNERIVSIDILTNGTLITEEDIHRLKKISKLHQIQISLDGGTAEVHDSVRGKGAFVGAINAIRMLRKADIEVALMFTLMKLNKSSYMEFIDIAEAENVNAITLERVTPCGNSNLEDILTAEEVKKIYTEITLRANEMNQIPVIRRARPLWVNTLCDNTRTDANIGGFCPVGLTALAILWDGTGVVKKCAVKITPKI